MSDTRYIATNLGVNRFDRPHGEHEHKLTKRYRFDTPLSPASDELARAAQRNGLDDEQLIALRHRARGGHKIAQRAVELLETEGTLTNEWRSEVNQLVADWYRKR